ncbi:MAG: hypothetical protein JWP76_3578 [Dactylosporangium sp.]|nr:hypothetical protein [Dactylosporangium sp.]
MPRRPSPFKQTAVATLAVLLVIALPGCGSGGGKPIAPAPVAHELSALLSTKNGLYYPPFLRNEPAGPEDNSYAIRIRSLLGDTPQLSLSGKTAAFFHDEAVAASPLWGRMWLAPLASSGSPGVLADTDVAAVRAMRTDGGWFSEPDSPRPDTPEYRAAATAAALEVLRSRGPIAASDRQVTLAWLDTASRSHPALPVAADLARSYRLLDAPVPAPLAALPRPPARTFAGLGPQARYEYLLEAYSYASLTAAAGGKAELDRAAWQHVLEHNTRSLGYRDLYYLVVVASAAGTPVPAFAGVRARIADNTLPDGAVRDPDAYVGSPEASLYALRLRALAGESTRDTRLADALRKASAEHQASAGPYERLVTSSTLHLAGAAAGPELCRSPDAVPTAVTQDNVEAWSRAALACVDSGAKVSVPGVAAWPLDDPAGVTAASTLVTGLTDSGHPHTAPSWISAQALRPWATNPERLGSTSGYATTVRAYLLLGGRFDQELRDGIRQGIDDRHGCPQLPSLYQADGTEPACDLKATWAVWKLKLLSEGHLPGRDAPVSNPPRK